MIFLKIFYTLGQVQETGENNHWLLNTKPGGITDEQALDCYMKGALWTWFEGGPKTTTFACGNKPSCGEWCTRKAYCDPNLGTYDLDCSSRTNGGQVCKREIFINKYAIKFIFR